MRREGDYTQIFTQATPDDQGSMIVDWTYLDFRPSNTELYQYDVSGGMCLQKQDGKYEQTNGDVRLWRLEDNTLVKRLTAPMCTPRTPEVLFTNGGRELHAASTVGGYYGDALYRWDNRKQTYVPPPYISAPEEAHVFLARGSTNIIIDPFYEEMFDGALFDAFGVMQLNYYDRGDYASALTSLDNLITAASPEADPIIINALHYWRGMTLERLDRPDEALAEYMTIIKTAPESAWGQLAALHVEVVE